MCWSTLAWALGIMKPSLEHLGTLTTVKPLRRTKYPKTDVFVVSSCLEVVFARSIDTKSGMNM